MRANASLKETLIYFVEQGVLLSQIYDVFGAAGLTAAKDTDSKKFYGYRNEILKFLHDASQGQSA